MNDRRKLFRTSVRRKGVLRYRAVTAICEIQDLTEKGLQIQTDLRLTVGEMVDLEFQLADHTIIHCALLVIHTHKRRIGGRIVNISTEYQEALTGFIEQMTAVSLVGM